MCISLELIAKENYDDIYDFEVVNKEYFEETLPPRCEGYFNKDIFLSIMSELKKEEEDGLSYMYIIRDAMNQMVGRVNFYNIKSDKTAEIGYRIASNASRKGYASKGVKMALKIAFENHGFKRIQAGTSPKNIGSRKILEKNDFLLVDKVEKVFKVNGIWQDGLIFEKSK